MFQAVTGFYCPGCGGTRAVKYLLRAEVGRSIQYHPLVCLYGIRFDVGSRKLGTGKNIQKTGTLYSKIRYLCLCWDCDHSDQLDMEELYVAGKRD